MSKRNAHFCKRVLPATMADNIAVSVRVRPLNSKEESKGAAWDINSETNAIAPQVRLALGPVAVVACFPSREGGNYKSSRPSPTPDIRSPYPPHAQAGSSAGTTDSTSYQLDNVFDPSCRTKDVYDRTTRGIIESVLNGFNGTVFAYGQTSSGKTHTMQGSAEEPGIIPLAVHDVFDSIDRSEGREFLVRVSYLEIYNEQMVDLFSADTVAPPTKPQMGSSGSRDLFGSSIGGGSFDRPERRVSRLQIKEDSERGVYVSGLKEEIVTSPTQVLELLRTGVARRHVGETNMNAESSRSHTIFRMVVESRAVGENASGAANGAQDAVLVATLNLVDLAGSERVVKTGAEGIRMKEGANINKSLLNLGIVINKLTEGAEGKGSHIPFRDSKLTRILQPALGGNSKTAIVCNVTPAAAHAEETHSTLRFAVRAKRVCNNATVNEVVSESALIKRQQREIEELRKKLGGEGGVSQEVEEEINALRREMLEAENERERLANELEIEREERERAEKAASAKISNLTNLVLKSSAMDADGACDKRPKRGNRRETWAPNNRGGVPDFLKGRKLPPGVSASLSESVDEEAPEEAPAGAPAGEFDPAAEAKARKERRRGGLLPPPPALEELEECFEDERRASDASDVSRGSFGRGRFSGASEGTDGADTWGGSPAPSAPGTPGVTSADHAAAVAAAVAAVRSNMEAVQAEMIAAAEAAANARVAALEEELGEAKAQIEELNTEKMYIERDMERLQTDAEEAMKHQKAQLEGIRAQMTSDREKAKEKVAAANARASDAESARAKATAEAAAMVEANKLAEARNAQLRAEISAAADAAMAGRSAAANEARSKAQAEVEAARAASESQAEAAFEARTSAAVAAVRAEMESANAELRAKVDDLEDMLATAIADKEKAEAAAAEDAKAAGEAREAKAEVAKLTKELKSTAAAPKQMMREAESMRKDLEKARDKAQQFEGKFRVALQEKAAAVVEKGTLEKELKRLRASQEAASKNGEKKGKIEKAKVERLESQLGESKAALLASQNELKKLASHVEKATADRDAAIADRVKAENRLEPLTKELEQARREMAEARAEARRVAEEASASDEAAAEARAKLSEVDALRSELDAARKEAAEAAAHAKAREEETGIELRAAQRKLSEASNLAATAAIELRTTVCDRDSANAELAQLKTEFREAERGAEELKRREADARDQLARLCDELELERSRALSLETRLAVTGERGSADVDRHMREADEARRDAAKARAELAAMEKTVQEMEPILEEAVARAEDEAMERGKLERRLAAMNNSAFNGASSGNGAAAAAAAAELTALNAQLERRAVRAEDRMHEVERQMAKLRAEAMVGAPITPSTTFGSGSRATPGSGGGASQGHGPDVEEVKQLKLELKERKRQMHKLQEVYGRLKAKFVAAGGSAAAFDAQRDVTGLQYELQFTETKRAAERKRAEQLALDLGKARKELESLRGDGTGLGGVGNNANVAAAKTAGFSKLSMGGLATVDENAAPA